METIVTCASRRRVKLAQPRRKLLVIVVVLACSFLPHVQCQDACTTTAQSDRCACYERAPDFIVDCTNAGLTSIPTNIPAQTTILGLSHNSIERIPGRIFNTLVNVRILYLIDNGLKVLEPGAFSGMQSLKSLWMAYNQLNSTTGLSNIPSLKMLHLENNKFEEVETEAFAGLSSLQHLNLGNNLVTQLHDRAFAHHHLKTLDLSGNRLDFISGLALEGASAVSELDLSNNRFSALAPSMLQPLVNLTTFAISDNELKSLPGVLFSQQTRLHTLDLSGNKLEAFNIDMVGTSPLRILRLNNNALSSVVYGNDTRWDNLEQLYLRDNAWYCCGLEWFRDAVSVVQDVSSILCVAPLNVAGELLSSTSGPITVCDKLTPNAPPAVAAAALSSSALNITWVRPHGNYERVAHYTVEYKHNTTGAASSWTQLTCPGGAIPPDPSAGTADLPCDFLDRDPVTDNNVTPLQASISGLSPFTVYAVRVRASNSQGASPYAHAFGQTLEDLPSTPPAPIVYQQSSRSLAIQLAPPNPSNGVITEYLLSIATAQGVPGASTYVSTSVTLNGQTTTHAFEGLEPSTTYNLTVVAYTSIGASPVSAVAQGVTLPDKPERAPSLASTSANETSCTFMWQPLGSNDTHGEAPTYNVYAVNASSGEVLQLLGTTPATTFTWTGIAANTRHRIILSANTTAGEGPRSSAYVCRTDPFPPSKPAAPMVEALCAREVRVSWSQPQQPNGVVVRYDVWQVQGSSSSSSSRSRRKRVYSGPNLAVGLSGLEPAMEYGFYIVAFTTLSSEPSSTTTVTTPTGVPPAVPQARLVDTAKSNMTITWDAVTPCDGHVQAYLVYQVLKLQTISYYPFTKDSSPKLVAVAGGNTTSIMVNDLEPATAYTFTIRARNKYGESPAIKAATFVTADAPPSQPGQPTMTMVGDVQIVKWTRPEMPNGNISHYELWSVGDSTPLYTGHPGKELQFVLQQDQTVDGPLFVIAYNAAGGTKSSIAASSSSSNNNERTAVGVVVAIAVLLVVVLIVLLAIKMHSKKRGRISEGDLSVRSVQPLVPIRTSQRPSIHASTLQTPKHPHADRATSAPATGTRGGEGDTTMKAPRSAVTSTPAKTVANRQEKRTDKSAENAATSAAPKTVKSVAKVMEAVHDKKQDGETVVESGVDKSERRSSRTRNLPTPPPPLNKEELQWSSSSSPSESESDDESDDMTHRGRLHSNLPAGNKNDITGGGGRRALPARLPPQARTSGGGGGGGGRATFNPFAMQGSSRDVVSPDSSSAAVAPQQQSPQGSSPQSRVSLKPIRGTGAVQRPVALPSLSQLSSV